MTETKTEKKNESEQLIFSSASLPVNQANQLNKAEITCQPNFLLFFTL